MSDHGCSAHYASLHCIDQNYSLHQNINISNHGLTNHFDETSYARTSNCTKPTDDRIKSWGSSEFVPSHYNSLKDLDYNPMLETQGVKIPETNNYAMDWIE